MRRFAEGLLAFFVPGAIRVGPRVELFRARQIVFVSLAAACFAIPYFVYRVVSDGWMSALTLLLGAVIICISAVPWVLKLTGSVNASGLTLLLSGSAILITYCFLDGGFFSSALMWYPLLPLFGIYFLGAEFGLLIVGIVFIDIIVMAYAQVMGWVPEVSVDEAHQVFLYASSTVGVVLVLVVQALLYVNSQREIQAELEEVNRVRDDFLSGMSHELRTPLNSIMGFSELLEAGYGGELNETQSSYVRRIQLGSTHLKELVDDLLNIVKLESEGFDVNPSRIDAGTTVRTIIEMFHSTARDQNIALSFVPHESLSERELYIDEQIMREILFNLLSNAIKFTPEDGRVEVRARVEPSKLIIDVIDSGPGIDDAYRDRVFDRFFQVHTQAHNKSPGTGLGLYLAKHLSEIHGGELVLQPSDAGTHFTATLGISEGQGEIE